MRARLQNIWENISSSLWFVPTVLVLVALALSSILIEVDATLHRRNDPLIPWLFSGTADAGRSVLSVIAGSLITVISIAFSITIIALQQASAQFTPRVLRQFTASRSNQFVLGVYTATFVYALLVLRSVRSQTESVQSAFVPALSITVAIALALLCLGLLIFFIHHMSRSLQVAVIMDRVHRELVAQVDALYPLDAAEPNAVSEAPMYGTVPLATIRSQQAGFIRRIDEAALCDMPLANIRALRIVPRVGQFITHGGTLAELDPPAELTDELADQLRAAFVIDLMPSINQDPLFGVRQLVDIALKALSPGINDMTTAEYALNYLGDALGRLAERPFPQTVYLINQHRTRISFNRPSWDDFVTAAFNQVRRAGENDPHVTATLLRVLHDLAVRVPSAERSRAIQHQVAEIRQSLETHTCSPHDKALLLERASEAEYALPIPTPQEERETTTPTALHAK